MSSSGNDESFAGLIEQYLKPKPPRFVGIGNPEETDAWIDRMEKIYALLNCNEVDKIALA